eukprot:CAMPEP_0118917896 /NCGR_PEP_ID=MMETSP1166-20130328/17589_1 /TAXON_ID=1104430 /ORGANISM="Chrysoreinhardia sp, Strain CCMP3193" /LENGTH=199 /DNA_ID=CAMNT_0006858119 /DNA_START=66 /DNA_END=665 /DNA_ORIENTATION=-
MAFLCAGCDCVTPMRAEAPEAKGLLAVVTFDVANFQAWYKGYEGAAPIAEVSATFVGETKRRERGVVFTTTQSAAHIVHVLPEAALEKVKEIYAARGAEWKAKSLTFTSGAITSRHDDGDLDDFDMMTTVVADNKADVEAFLQSADVAQAFVAKNEQKTLAVLLYPKSSSDSVLTQRGDQGTTTTTTTHSTLLFKKGDT